MIGTATSTGGRAHVVHLSASGAVPVLRNARAAGVDVSVETCPHYLHFDAETIPDGATELKCCPPIRDAANRDALWAALEHGDIDFVVSDHSPCTAELKRRDTGDFADAWGGIASLQLGLSVVWTDRPRARARPGRRGRAGWPPPRPGGSGSTRKGEIAVGADADLCVFAPDEEFVVDVARLHHKNPVSAYAGRTLTGTVRRTWLRGVPIDLDAAPRGRLLRRAAMSYWVPTGGLPAQTDLTTDRAVFTEAYAVLPRGTMRDIVTSRLPFWDDTRLWVIARPLSGFAETFSWYVVEVARRRWVRAARGRPGGRGRAVRGRRAARRSPSTARRTSWSPGAMRSCRPAPPGRCATASGEDATFHWIRKAYESVEGIDVPAAFVTHERDVAVQPMPGTDGAWGTQRFVDPDDVRHDLHVNIVSFEPGGAIPFPETHVMEHGLYVLEGKAVYLLNKDWVEVQEGDFMWLRAFCPQACYAGGTGPVPLPALQGRQPAPATPPRL